MTPTSKETTLWRASGSYLPTLASKTSLIEETRQFLLTYARLGDVEATRQALVNGGLPQRSRATRANIVKIVQMRLTRWHPPVWVLDDLIAFAQDGHQAELQAALLVHTARQDHLLYDIVQQVVVPRWSAGERELITADIQRFLDDMQSVHPEVAGWSHSTREKLSRNVLTTSRDFGLLQGTASKQIVEPIVPLTGEWSARDLLSINRTFSGLTKLIFPAGIMGKEDTRMLLRLAIELRLRVLVQLHTMNEQEFHVTELSFRDWESGEV